MKTVKNKLFLQNTALFLGGPMHGAVQDVDPERDRIAYYHPEEAISLEDLRKGAVKDNVKVIYYIEENLNFKGTVFRIFIPEPEMGVSFEAVLVKVYEEMLGKSDRLWGS